VIPASPKRRFRGYDRRQTDELLADLGTRFDQVRGERDALAASMEELRRERAERERHAGQELEQATEELAARKQQVTELQQQVSELERGNAQHLDELRRLREELLQTQLAQQRLHADWADQHASVARLALRERALVEQVVMLRDELQRGATEVRPLPPGEPAAASTVPPLDRLVESVARETPADAEFDPVSALQRTEAPADDGGTADDLQQHLGEALWTSRDPADYAPE
jgi:ABC-type transporter Mla subunit MlaD